MPDLVPDPATRDLLREAFEEGCAYMRSEADDFDVWLARKFPPPLPPEPPNGASCRGAGTDVWVREDDEVGDGHRWWVTGRRESFTWAEALGFDADPARRLVELPDPDHDAAMIALQSDADQIALDAETIQVNAAFVVRALTEQGTATRVHPPEPTAEEWAAHADEPDETPALQARRDQIQATKETT